MRKPITFFNPEEPTQAEGSPYGVLVKNSKPKRRLSQNGFALWFVILTLIFVPINIAFGRSLGELMLHTAPGTVTPFYSSLTFLIPTLIAFIYLMLITFVASRRIWAINKKKTKWLWALPILDLVVLDVIIIKWLYMGFEPTQLVEVWPVLVGISIVISSFISLKKNR